MKLSPTFLLCKVKDVWQSPLSVPALRALPSLFRFHSMCMFKKGDSNKWTLISSQGHKWLLAEKKEKRKGLRTAPACANPSLNINAFFPQDTNTGAGDICVYMSLSTLCRCTTGKRNLCTYAHLGRLFSTSNLIPRVAPGPLWLPIVLLQASLRHTVLQLPSTAAAMCIQWHRYIIHLFIYCLSKKLTHT